MIDQVRTRVRPIRTAAMLLAVAAIGIGGCRSEMYDQPKYQPLEMSTFFADSQASRPKLEGTVARGWYESGITPLHTDSLGGATDASHGAVSSGADGHAHHEMANPMPLTREVVLRGQERYDIYCSPCHGRTGDGNGMIVQRGFPAPPSFHIERLRTVPDGHVFDVITNGFGAMYSYANRVKPEDRWAIAHYIRALQLTRSELTTTSPSQLSGIGATNDTTGSENPGGTTR